MPQLNLISVLTGGAAAAPAIAQEAAGGASAVAAFAPVLDEQLQAETKVQGAASLPSLLASLLQRLSPMVVVDDEAGQPGNSAQELSQTDGQALLGKIVQFLMQNNVIEDPQEAFPLLKSLTPAQIEKMAQILNVPAPAVQTAISRLDVLSVADKTEIAGPTIDVDCDKDAEATDSTEASVDENAVGSVALDMQAVQLPQAPEKIAAVAISVAPVEVADPVVDGVAQSAGIQKVVAAPMMQNQPISPVASDVQVSQGVAATGVMPTVVPKEQKPEDKGVPAVAGHVEAATGITVPAVMAAPAQAPVQEVIEAPVVDAGEEQSSPTKIVLPAIPLTEEELGVPIAVDVPANAPRERVAKPNAKDSLTQQGQTVVKAGNGKPGDERRINAPSFVEGGVAAGQNLNAEGTSSPEVNAEGTVDAIDGGRNALHLREAVANANNNTSRADANRLSVLKQDAPVPVAEQVLLKIRSGVTQNQKHYEIHLEPNDLGKVEVRMDVGADGRTHVAMTVDKKETLDLLQRDRVSLEKTLNDLGLKADAGSMSFNLREQGRGQQFADQQQGNGGSWKGEPLPEELREDATPAQPYRGMILSLDEGVNIQV